MRWTEGQTREEVIVLNGMMSHSSREQKTSYCLEQVEDKLKMLVFVSLFCKDGIMWPRLIYSSRWLSSFYFISRFIFIS